MMVCANCGAEIEEAFAEGIGFYWFHTYTTRAWCYKVGGLTAEPYWLYWRDNWND